jgi:hypothetical protein
VPTKRKPNDDQRPADSARAEAVEILAGAVFTLLLAGRIPPVPPGHHERLESGSKS